MTAVSAFSSNDGAVLEAWEAAQEDVQQWNERAKAMKEKYDGYKLLVQQSAWDQGRRVVGLGGNLADNPGGFRLKDTHYWVPDMRTKLGKAAQRELEDLELQAPDLPGMPKAVMVGHTLYKPGYDLFDGELWVSWGCSEEAVFASDWSTTTVDPLVWTSRKLSEYYQKKEAVDEDVSARATA